MGLLSNLADNLLPRQKRGRGRGGRPLIDMPELSAGDFGYVGYTMNALTAVPEGAMKTVMANAKASLYTTGGFMVTLGGDYKAPVLSLQGVADALNDPNAAAHSAADFVGRTLGGRKGNFWTSTYRWNRMLQGFGDRYVKSMIKSSDALSSDEKDGLLEALNADAGWVPESIKKDGRDALSGQAVATLRANGIDGASANAFGSLLDNLDNSALRKKIYKRASVAKGRSGFYNRGKRIADALADELPSSPSLQSYLKGKNGEAIGGFVEKLLDASDQELVAYGYEERLRRIHAKGGDSALIADRLDSLRKQGNLNGRMLSVNMIRNLYFGVYSTNLKNGLLNGNALLWIDYGEGKNVFSRWTSGLLGDSKMKNLNINGLGGALFLLYPGSWTRMFWDGDWFKVLEAQLKARKLMDPKKYLPKFLKNGIKGNINEFRDKLLKEVGIKDLILQLEKLNPELARKIQSIFSSGLDEFARSWVKGAVKAAFKKAGESAAKLLAKVGLKELGKWLGTVILPGVGSIIGWIVGELVWFVVDSFLWKILEIMIQVLFLVIAIIIIVVIFVGGVFMESQNMFPVMLLPGQSLTTHNPVGGEEDTGGGEYLGPGVPFDYTRLDSGGILNSQYCSQGYFGNTSDPVCNWSHCNLVAKEGKYALDVTGSTDGIVYSPADGTVLKIVKNAESLDRIEIQSEGITFYMIHIDADTCRVAKGDVVNKGDALCKLYTNPGNVNVKCPNSNNICWTGPHVHIYAQNDAGVGVSNLHEIIKINANSCSTSDN